MECELHAFWGESKTEVGKKLFLFTSQWVTWFVMGLIKLASCFAGTNPRKLRGGLKQQKVWNFSVHSCCYNPPPLTLELPPSWPAPHPELPMIIC